ncbi:cryptochrome/photolyase family protein [Aliidiomarina sedimenti]|uniref:Cryptochrome/photolyase family protein n=1 Tax=Aliidiomarina sedimenti TaxID=1933879 RepID=A0ABY0BXW3_9GAMM|nr:cryptochrome/photolyase family protein [Aliidiomarina sedimenti]RUO29006.1 cryptochrome/photolyase family protein [Aliidiomarina sedimenti]
MALFYALTDLNTTRYREIRLILGDQLNVSHSWFHQQRDDTLYVMMEIRQETDYVRHHKQKLLAFFAAMRAFANALSNRHEILYLALDSRQNTHSLTDNLTMIIEHIKAESFSYQAPDEWRLDELLLRFKPPQVSVHMVDSEHFLTSRDALQQHFDNDNALLMETFYRRVRRQYGYLMDGDKPVGGKWNYDHENRNKLPAKQDIPTPLTFANDVTGLLQLIDDAGIETMGNASKELLWPVTRQQSRQLLDFFIRHCLPDFGRYQDALSERGWSLYHARLSFSMNSKMLSPREVVERAIEAYQHSDGAITLAQIEGFVRQIIGWREYVRAIYWAKMPDYAAHNKLQHQRKLPDFYWHGRTKMACMQHAVEQSLEYAYAHHIQRLMVTGNFALLAGVHPDQVDAWYLGIYIDAIEWVELPNTRGMSQFADGGLLATKPYVSSGNYLNKMGHYCKSCHYNVNQRSGEDACPFNLLYWHFIERHKDRLRHNHRMRMIYRQWEQRDASEREVILKQAERYLADLDNL